MFVFSLIHVALFIDVHLKSANTMGITNNILLNMLYISIVAKPRYNYKIFNLINFEKIGHCLFLGNIEDYCAEERRWKYLPC